MARVYVLAVGGWSGKHFWANTELIGASASKKRMREFAMARLQKEKDETITYCIHIYNSKFGSAEGRVEFRKRSDGTISEKHFSYCAY
ncbi:MAG: hypothetical protein Q7R73_03955 [bacterium]|nr:hypothetical protein [bacterium]